MKLLYEQVKKEAAACGGLIERPAFGAAVDLSILFPAAEAAGFSPCGRCVK